MMNPTQQTEKNPAAGGIAGGLAAASGTGSFYFIKYFYNKHSCCLVLFST